MEVDVEWEKLNLWKFLGVSGLFFFAESVLLYPMFVLKTKEQISSSVTTRNLGATKTILQRTIHNQGIRGLYKGFSFSFVFGLPNLHIYFLTYHFCKHKLSDVSYIPPIFSPMISGALAESASLFGYVPVDVVLQRLQLRANLRKSGRELANELYKKEGISAFYRGFNVTVLTLGIGSATWWLCYEQLKQIFQGFGQFGVVSAGIVAGSTASIVSQPFDVVKTRMQTAESGYDSILKGFRILFNQEGYRGFLRGLPTKIIGRAPINGLAAFGYELVLKHSTDSD